MLKKAVYAKKTASEQKPPKGITQLAVPAAAVQGLRR